MANCVQPTTASRDLYLEEPIPFKSEVDCLQFLDQNCQLAIEGNDLAGGVGCNGTWDTVMCWASTPANTTVKLPCPHWKPGLDHTKFAYRTCDATGRWADNLTGLRPNGWTNYTSCINFAPAEHVQTLKVITFAARILETIGLSLSLISVTAAIAVFFYFRGIRCDRIRIHRNLFVAVNIHVAIFLVKTIDQLVAMTSGSGRSGGGSGRGADQGSRNLGSLDGSLGLIPIVCQLLIVSVEYTKTVMFAWMFIEGYHLHTKLIVSVFSFKPNYFIYYTIGWVIPLLVTASWATVYGLHGTSASSRCWNGYTHDWPIFWIIESPRAVIVAVNMLFLLNILRVLVTKLRQNNSDETEQLRKAVKAAFVLLPLLGANHVLAMTGPLSMKPVLYGLWAFSTCLLTGFQGVVISLLYCFFNVEVRSSFQTTSPTPFRSLLKSVSAHGPATVAEEEEIEPTGKVLLPATTSVAVSSQHDTAEEEV